MSSAGAPLHADVEALRRAHRFVSDGQQAPPGPGSALAAAYDARLYKELAVADLSLYRAGKLGLRWRTREEVWMGLGHTTCGGLGCGAAAGLAAFEVPFAYHEAGEHKLALVKLRLCGGCAAKLLHYRAALKGGGGGGGGIGGGAGAGAVAGAATVATERGGRDAHARRRPPPPSPPPPAAAAGAVAAALATAAGPLDEGPADGRVARSGGSDRRGRERRRRSPSRSRSRSRRRGRERRGSG